MKHPSQSNVVIVGAGVIGCSAAYQLAKNGVKDVVVLERKKIACGTSWHAAGILSEMRASESMIAMAKETTDMFMNLEKETGHDIHFKRTGTVFVTAVPERFKQFKMALSMAKSFGVEAHEISVREAKQKWPLVNADDLIGALWVPNDALICPERGTIALAKGAEMHGAKIYENTAVTKLIHKNGRVTGVETPFGRIDAEYVVMTTGIWARDFLADYSVNAPLHATEHFYLLTEKINGVDPMLPLLRDYDARNYTRPSVGMRWHTKPGHLLLGFFERNAKPWGMDGIPDDFEFGRLNEDWGHVEAVLKLIKHRIPAVRDVKIETFLCGPESFTYDNNYFMGEAQQMRNLLLAVGFNSRGIQSSGGAGRYIAEWIINGAPPARYDTHDVDAGRFPAYTANRKFLRDRSREVLGLLYDINFPYLQVESGRPVRTSPLHDRLKNMGACFGELSGWERANWFAPPGVKPKYDYTFDRQNWFAHAAEEHMATRENVTVFDQSSFGKILVQGVDALPLLEMVCGNRIDVPIGKVVYTQMLNETGGIESDFTVTRIDDDEFLIYTTASSQARDYFYLKKKAADWALNAVLTDVTSAYSVLGVMGPRSRELLQKMSNASFSNDDFPFATSRMIDFGYARARATRLTFVGELGWEISLPTEFALSAFDTLMKEGEAFSLKPAGYHAMNSLRLEKSFVHWGHDVGCSDTPIEANLGFALRFKKSPDFLGKSILQKQKTHGVSKRLVTFKLKDGNPLLYHYEPIIRNGKSVGYITSGMFCPYVGRSIGMGYVKNPDGIVDDDFIMEAKYQINVLHQNYDAIPSMTPFYDAEMKRVKM